MVAGLRTAIRGWNLGEHLRFAAPLAAAILMVEAIGFGVTAFAGLVEHRRDGTLGQRGALDVVLLATIAISVGVTSNSTQRGFGTSAPRHLLGLAVGLGQFLFAGVLMTLTVTDPLDGLTNTTMALVSVCCVLAGASALARLFADARPNDPEPS